MRIFVLPMTAANLGVQPFNMLTRAGRAWPSSGIVVEVLDDENDPSDRPLAIGQRTYRALRGDTRLRLFPAGAIAVTPSGPVLSEGASRARDPKRQDRLNELLLELVGSLQLSLLDAKKVERRNTVLDQALALEAA